jgi:hypothetical protein
VWFFVPSTNQAATLEDMSFIFGRELRDHARAQGERLYIKNVKGPRYRWTTALKRSRGEIPGKMQTNEIELKQIPEIHVAENGTADSDAILPAP